jgi:conjugal transfer pilus assembly protein TraV
MIRLFVTCAAVAVVGQLAGCASGVSAYGGESSFNCEVKLEGIPCNSISGTDRNLAAGKLPHQQNERKAVSPETVAMNVDQLKTQKPVTPNKMPGLASGPAPEVVSPRQMTTANTTGMPLRVQEKVLRVWMAPFEDEDGSLHDQKFIFMAIARGSWQIESNRINPLNNGFKQVFPLGNRTPDTSDSPRSERTDARSQANAAVTNNPNLNTVTAPAAPQQRSQTLRSAQQDAESQ